MAAKQWTLRAGGCEAFSMSPEWIGTTLSDEPPEVQ